jgi:hypothetical protein
VRDEEREVRDLLEDAVSDVEPRYALDAIQARTASPGRSRQPWMWAAAGAAAAAVVAGVSLLGGPTAPQAAAPATSPQVTEPATSASAPTSPAGGAASVVVPVYYVGGTAHGPRLFREFHRAPSGMVFDVAADDAVRGNASDPDYRTAWPSGTTMNRAQLSDGVLSVDLGGPVTARPRGMDEATAALALQQLVLTEQGVAQSRVPVTFLVDGSPAKTVLGLDTRQPVAASTGEDVLAQVQVDDPADGSSVGSTFTVRGRAAAFEANVQWELMQGGTEVKKGFTTAQECCTLSPFSFDVTGVAPGDYTLVVHDEDPSGGHGKPPWQDTKQITVH